MPHVVADTTRLQADGIITPQAAAEIEARGRATMITLAINTLLCFGILSATGGLIFWLADAATVAVVGLLCLGGGLALLARGRADFSMFGNAAALIGAGMLVGGASIELIQNYDDIAGWVMLPGGAVIALIAGRRFLFGGLTAQFVAGAILLMGLAMHLAGIGYLLWQAEVTGLPKALFYLYAAVTLAGAGWVTDVRLVTALAIVPLAQMLDTGTGYFHAAYVFYSPEPTLSILQMTLVVAGLIWLVNARPERTARHGRILTIMAFIVANLCALVGSLWGDVVGETLWGPGRYPRYRDLAEGQTWDDLYQDWREVHDAFLESAVSISADLYTILWAVALVAVILWAAHRSNRGLFNAGLTFAGIHFYTQLFESFSAEPLAWVIGGLSAIPLAWGAWKINQRWGSGT